MKVHTVILKKCLFTLLLFLCAAASAFAQELRFTTHSNASVIASDEMVRVQFLLENPVNFSGEITPNFKGFTVIQGPEVMQSTSYVNGKVSSYISYSYVLQPQAPGRYTIPGAVARVDGKLIKSNPLNIEVVKGGAGAQIPQPQQAQPQPPPSRGGYGRGGGVYGESHPGVIRKGEDVKDRLRKNIFVKVEVDKTTVYEGEQITATYKLYTRLPTNSNVTKVPAFKGFSAKDIELPNPPRAQEEIVNGMSFNVFVIRKTLLFPLQSGELELDPAEVDNQVHFVKLGEKRKRAANDPFNDPFFRDAFGGSPFDDYDPFSTPEYEVIPYRIQSPVLKVTVKPLPTAGRPASFNGAVGKFTMTAQIDKNKISTDDALTLKVNIAGQGNVNLLSAPPLNIPRAFEKYDPTVTDNIERNSNPLSGNRQFQYALMPQEKGDYELPPVEFSYFDPAAQAYKTLTSSPFSVHVTQGKERKRDRADFGGVTDLADIRVSGQNWSKNSPFFFGKPFFWILLLLPLLGIAGVAWYRRRQNYISSNAALLRHRHANRVALKRLELAARYLKEGKDKAFYEETSRATWGYLSHKLKIPMAELSKQLVQEKLTVQKVSEGTMQKLMELIDRCEMALYAPAGSNELRQGAYQEAVEVISAIEDELKSKAPGK